MCLGMIRILKVSWMSEACLDSNFKPSLGTPTFLPMEWVNSNKQTNKNTISKPTVLQGTFSENGVKMNPQSAI